MKNLQKLIIVAVLLSIWVWLIFWGKTPVEQLVTAIRDALIGMGVFHASLTNPKE